MVDWKYVISSSSPPGLSLAEVFVTFSKLQSVLKMSRLNLLFEISVEALS